MNVFVTEATLVAVRSDLRKCGFYPTFIGMGVDGFIRLYVHPLAESSWSIKMMMRRDHPATSCPALICLQEMTG